MKHDDMLYLMGQSMAGILAFPNRDAGKMTPERLARICYENADAVYKKLYEEEEEVVLKTRDKE